MKTVPLPRSQFYMLHQEIVKKCDAILRQSGNSRWINGLCRTKYEAFYGFANAAEEEDSIRMVMVRFLTARHFAFNKKEGQIQFDGRELYDCRNTYFNYPQKPVEVKEYYLKAWLQFLEIPDANALRPVETPLPEWIDVLGKGKMPARKQTLSPVAGKSDSNLLKNLENTIWHFYEFGTKVKTKDTARLIRRILKIHGPLPDQHEHLAVELLTPDPDKKFADFVGKMFEKSEKIIMFELSTKLDNTKCIIGMIWMDSARRKPLYLGQYLKYDDDDNIMSGTIIIHKQDAESADISPKIFSYGSEDIVQEVPKPIRDYFSDKWKNFTKSPTGKSTLDDLKDWLAEKRSSSNLDIDLFVATPITELGAGAEDNESEIEAFKKEVESMRQDVLWEKMGIHSIYCPLLDESRKGPEDIKHVLLREYDYFSRSRAFLLIFMPSKPIQSSVFMELGWAIQSGKPTYIVYNDRKLLPQLVRYAKVLENVHMPDSDNPIGIRDIPEWLYLNEIYPPKR